MFGRGDWRHSSSVEFSRAEYARWAALSSGKAAPSQPWLAVCASSARDICEQGQPRKLSLKRSSTDRVSMLMMLVALLATDRRSSSNSSRAQGRAVATALRATTLIMLVGR